MFFKLKIIIIHDEAVLYTSGGRNGYGRLNALWWALKYKTFNALLCWWPHWLIRFICWLFVVGCIKPGWVCKYESMVSYPSSPLWAVFPSYSLLYPAFLLPFHISQPLKQVMKFSSGKRIVPLRCCFHSVSYSFLSKHVKFYCNCYALTSSARCVALRCGGVLYLINLNHFICEFYVR